MTFEVLMMVIIIAIFFDEKREAEGSSKTLVTVYQTVRRHIPEYSSFLEAINSYRKLEI
jgi:hypothetical protein